MKSLSLLFLAMFCVFAASAEASVTSLVGSQWAWGGSPDHKLTFPNTSECFISDWPIEKHSWSIVSDDTIEIKSEDNSKRIYRITFTSDLKKGEITLFNKKKDTFIHYGKLKRLKEETEQGAAANP